MVMLLLQGWSFSLLITIHVACVHPISSSSEFNTFSFQSGGPASDLAQRNTAYGDTFSTGLFYDEHHQLLYITGTTYGSSSFHRLSGPWEQSNVAVNNFSSVASDCFFGMIRLPLDNRRSPDWIQGLQFGTMGVTDSCTDIQASKRGKLYIAGSSKGSPGLLASLASSSTSTSGNKVNGLILDFDVNKGFEGGMLMQENQAQYPVTMDRDPDSKTLFVATLVEGGIIGNNSVLVQRFSRIPQTTSNLIPTSGGIHTTLQSDWQQHAMLNVAGNSLIVSSLVFHRPTKLLFLGGSTTGEGHAFGQRNNGTFSSMPSMNGFVTKLDASSGEILNVTRISSASGGSDYWIWGLCAPSSPTNGTAANIIYAVGVISDALEKTSVNNSKASTKAAYLIKINTDSMAVLWTRRLTAKQQSPKTEAHFFFYREGESMVPLLQPT